ncbi:hypothetical protein JMJ77_0010470 [Colletotrichum scovillei]|uniref:Uncharacterized protein n=1 Tax=Colletotrichum scovillei TaxID=1209932 RepID=A0A9P7U584_9PEZI|nr:hypothetical protein JMJ78_0011841 [Colletotrichum scovillei]KAG7042371.1 hypothetical protein JMJ77_0010470 [Colletotrichum scovillei]KAG7062405.1 hypothetical protein JMJ76_0006679 [Colletotrichum scovillei]
MILVNDDSGPIPVRFESQGQTFFSLIHLGACAIAEAGDPLRYLHSRIEFRSEIFRHLVKVAFRDGKMM